MTKRLLSLLALVGTCLQGRADVFPLERLLPKDTVLVVAAPDWSKAQSFLSSSSYGRLWHDPAMRPFREKFTERFTTNAVHPLEQTLGIKFSDYTGLAEGEACFALLPVQENEKADRMFSKLLLLDTKSHSSELKTNLASIRKKWIAAGKAIKTQKIREIDFTTFIISASDISWNKIFPQAGPLPEGDSVGRLPARNSEITFGQVDSLLIVSDSPGVIEKVLTLQHGGLLAPLAEEASFQSDFAARLRGAPSYCWMNVQALMSVLAKAPAPSDDDDEAAAAALKMVSMLNGVGLDGVTSACLSCQETAGGGLAQFFVGSPDSKRAGVLKVLAPENKDASPPPFVPANAAKFWRWRINIPGSWTKLETMMNEWNPQFSKVLSFIFQNAGKDKDEHYDLKSELLNNLGDDVICYEKAPDAKSFADLKSPPGIYLIGSPNPEKLSSAMTVALGIMAQGAGAKEREFLGRKIRTVALGNPENPATPTVSFSASGGYLALSSNTGMLEEFLRSTDNKSKTLMESAPLAESAQFVGGLSTGWFGFESQNQEMRPMFDLFRSQRPSVTEITGTPAITGNMNVMEQMVGKVLEWSDFTLLPPYGSVSKYFYYSVYAGRFSPDGFTLKIFSAAPPALR